MVKHSDWSMLRLFGLPKIVTLQPLTDLDLPRPESTPMVPSEAYFANEREYAAVARHYLRNSGALVCRLFPKDGSLRSWKRGIKSYDECRAYIKEVLAGRPDVEHDILINEDSGTFGGAIVSGTQNGIPYVAAEAAADRTDVLYGKGEVYNVRYNHLEAMCFQRTENVDPELHRKIFGEVLGPLKIKRGEYIPGYYEFFITPQGDVKFVEALIEPEILKRMRILQS